MDGTEKKHTMSECSWLTTRQLSLFLVNINTGRTININININIVCFAA